MTLAWIGALLVGLSLGLMGSGGSILTVPVLIYLVGQDEKVAIAGSLAIVGGIAAIASLPYARRRLVDYRSVVLFGGPGMAGAYAGASLSALVSGSVQLGVFVLLMLVAAVMMARPVALEPASGQRRRAWKVASEGLVVGVITGFVGVGGGFMIVPALVLLGGLPIHRAVGTSLTIIALKSVAGFYKYTEVLERLDLDLDWHTIGVFILLGTLGSFVGSAVSGWVPQRMLRRGFAGFLAVIAVLIVIRSLG